MRKKTPQLHLRRRQLDSSLTPLTKVGELKPPPNGWIREIRETLGMSADHLSIRLGITRPSLADIEKNEAKKAITLKTLEKAAEALGCRLVYAVVPPESLEALLQARALKIAKQLVARLDHTMTLEDQQTSRIERQHQVTTIAEELVRTLGKALWSEL